MNRIALLVGIDRYESDDFEDLSCCVDDALAMESVISRHEPAEPGGQGERNFNCRTLTSEASRITADSLGTEVDNLMTRLVDGGDVLFYFSGHGLADESGGYLVTQEGTRDQPGLPMRRLLEAANRGRNLSVVIILDCCHSGQIGNVTEGENFNQVLIGANVTVLAAAGAKQESSEGLEHSLFTQLVLDALGGGASDVCGDVSAAAVYAYVEQALGVWEQRPVYKSYARQLRPIRRCCPAVPHAVLARLSDWFAAPEAEYSMDPSFEVTRPEAVAENVAVFDQFKLLRNARLLTTADGRDLYWTALESGSVHLTPQGRLFWKRARRGDF